MTAMESSPVSLELELRELMKQRRLASLEKRDLRIKADDERREWKRAHAVCHAFYRSKGYAVEDAKQAATADKGVMAAQQRAEHAEALAGYAADQLQDLRQEVIAVQSLISLWKTLVENGG